MGVLDWDARAMPSSRKRLALVRELLDLRRREIVPRLPAAKFAAARCDGRVLSADWSLADRQTLRLLANLSDRTDRPPRNFQSLRPIWGGAPPPTLPAWSVFWSIGAE
jgi:maltooligosyltrehalose trehalohydrolase